MDHCSTPHTQGNWEKIADRIRVAPGGRRCRLLVNRKNRACARGAPGQRGKDVRHYGGKLLQSEAFPPLFPYYLLFKEVGAAMRMSGMLRSTARNTQGLARHGLWNSFPV